jgi:EipB-like
MTMIHFARTAAVSIAAALQLGVASAVYAVPATSDVLLAPHRAVYDLTLASSKAGSSVAALNGRIVYELTGNQCEGYAQSMRYVTETIGRDGRPVLTDLRTSSWEAVPANRLRFNSVNYQDKRVAEQSQGNAERTSPSGPVSVELTRPAKRKIEMKGEVYFPIQHSMALIRAARAGRNLFTADLYDGSESGDKIYATSAAIGTHFKTGSKARTGKLKNPESLEDIPSWPVSIGYFPTGNSREDALPLYEMSYQFYDNGVTADLRIDHGDFAIRGELSKLELFEAGKCPGIQP